MTTQEIYWLDQWFRILNTKLNAILQGEKMTQQELDTLTQAVQQTETVEQSAVTLITELAQQLKVNANDPAAIQALADKLTTDAAALGSAIAANTPAAPTTTQPPATTQAPSGT